MNGEVEVARHGLGQTCALLTAVIWAVALILFKLSGERVGPLALNLFKNTVGLVLLAVTLAIGGALGTESLDAILKCPPERLVLLLVSGVVGIAIADTLFFKGLNLIGVGLLTVVDCCYAPMAVLFAWLLLDEQLQPLHYVGAALIVSGVFIATRHDLPAGRTRAQIAGGSLLAAVAVGLMAFAIVMVKPILEEMSVLWSTTIRLVGGTALLPLLAWALGGWRAPWAAFRPTRAWRTALPGSVLGTYVCLILWIAGFKYTYASIAAVLNQTSVIFAAVLASVWLKEEFGTRKRIALALASIGVVIVTFAGQLPLAWQWLVSQFTSA